MFDRHVRLAVKRVVDLVGAVIGLVVLAPVICWAALMVRLADGRPILFRQLRPGRAGRPFTVYKFRTMRPPLEGEAWYRTDELRMTRLGRFLRSSSIDELPELWNVLRGEMSLVGPRPLLMEYLGSYTEDERRRHAMRPGLTSWAVVHGRHVLRFRERLRLDTWYVDHWSLLLDARILAMTVSQVLRRADTTATQDLSAIGFPLDDDAVAESAVPGSAVDRPSDPSRSDRR